MTKKDDFRSVARLIKKELDVERLAFKTYQRERFTIELKAVAGAGAHTKGEDAFTQLEVAFLQEGLLVFPPLNDADEDGYTRIYRSGTRIAGILNAIRFPGGGSDEELSTLLGRLKLQTYDGGS